MTVRVGSILRVFCFVLSCLAAGPSFAHRDDYINETFVFQTLAAREFEPEVWLDVGSRNNEGSYRNYAAAFEYGITDRFIPDFSGVVDDRLVRLLEDACA